ncbi:selenium-binding protein [Litchfieldella qijiaojingensis]|uniref:Selenium-binding protein n=1 Tax=Litchfieldella qijiaojingensis TaxID=980347 RepID=A0ABQ2YZM8_9GAMM|nr:selenium-binding protein SBP56-related protein [Halomonas qijiaojingensis]GGX98585.1 selenium-binding protein [Halomonas qijiaojingensis]
MATAHDPSFYRSPADAAKAPPEKLAYVAMPNVEAPPQPDRLAVVDVDPDSPTYAQIVGQLEMPNAGDELHRFGWNACSACLCPGHDHHMERRYLIVPGIRSSRIHVIDTQPDPKTPQLHKVIEPQEVHEKTGYSRPHTVHCGPDGIYISALGAPDGEGPGGILLMDAHNFELGGAWEAERGDQYFAYDFWWHLMKDVMVTSEWATPNMIENGVEPQLLLGGKYGHCMHIWNLEERRHLETLDLGKEHQMVLELRPAHHPDKLYGFVGVVLSLNDLSASVWLWHRDNGKWKVQKVIEIPAEAAKPDDLPPLLKGFKAVPPLITDINLSTDDRFLYVSCWGTGELRQYDVTDPYHPKPTGFVRLGGIVRRSPLPSVEGPLNGGPQMVEVSRDGRRVYFTNSLYAAWDEQFYPDGVKGWMVKLDVPPKGGMSLDPNFFLEFDPRYRGHQVRLQGGDSSSDSYCYSK